MQIELPDKLEFLFSPSRYKVLYGGRGGAKSWSVARTLLILALKSNIRVLCTRELQCSIADSVHRLLSDQIEQLGLGQYFEILNNTVRCINGSEFLFSGLKTNMTKLKSMEGIDIAWVEEAETVSESSWSILIPTIRKAGSEIWVTFNPREKADPTYKRFIKHPPPGSVVAEIGWADNPWLPDELLLEKDYLYSVDPDAAAWVWGGQTRQSSKAQILAGKIVVEPFEPHPSWNGPYQGADWGFASSPTAFVRCWVEGGLDDLDRTLYIEREAFGHGVDIDATPELFGGIQDGHRYTTRADCARPETISHMQQHGYPLVVACTKGPGSVEDGIAHLRSYSRIVIHSRCRHAAEQGRLWSWRVDKLTEDVLPIPVKLHDDIWDAVRYALEPIMKRRKSDLVRAPESTGASKWNRG